MSSFTLLIQPVGLPRERWWFSSTQVMSFSSSSVCHGRMLHGRSIASSAVVGRAGCFVAPAVEFWLEDHEAGPTHTTTYKREKGSGGCSPQQIWRYVEMDYCKGRNRLELCTYFVSLDICFFVL